MKDNKYTHLAELYGFRCYFNEYTSEVEGTNWFNDKFIDIFLWIDLTFFENEYFEIKLIKEL